MATPTLNEIQTEILTNAAVADALPATAVLTDSEITLNSVTSTSKVSVFRLFIFVVATSMWALYKKVELLLQDITERMAKLRRYQIPWYIQESLLYRHGQPLLVDGSYDDTGLTIADIKALQVVSKAAVIQTTLNGATSLRFKLARTIDGNLEAVTEEQRLGFASYMTKKSYAGSKMTFTTGDADDLKLHYKIYFNPNILNNNGERLDGTDDSPIPSTLAFYLKDKGETNFNGRLAIDKITDVIQSTPGVVNAFKVNAWSKHGAFGYEDTNTQGTVGPFTEFRQPESGYFNLDTVTSIFEFVPAQ